jgi:hypothetical protein
LFSTTILVAVPDMTIHFRSAGELLYDGWDRVVNCVILAMCDLLLLFVCDLLLLFEFAVKRR